MTSEATPATWNSNEEDLVPTDYTEKLAYFKKMYGSPSSLPDINLIKEAFKVLDEYKPTTIGFKEIPNDALKQIFQKVDKNQDGYIDLSEFRELVSMLAEKYPWSPPSIPSRPGLSHTTDSSKPDEENAATSSKPSKPDDKAKSKSSNPEPGDEKPETGAKSTEQKDDKPTKPEGKAQTESSNPGDEKKETGAKSAEEQHQQ